MGFRMRFFHYLCWIVAWGLLGGCEAPRDNPLDPGAGNFIDPNYQVGSVEGRVTDLAFNPIVGALVLALPENSEVYRGAVTDGDGKYRIDEIKIGNCQVFTQPEGYVGDTSSVIVNFQQTTQKNFFLDALPQIYEFKVTSHFRYEDISPPEYYEVRSTAVLRDPDGFNDIDSVLLVTLEGDLRMDMEYNPDSTRNDSFFYNLIISEDQLPDGSIDSVKWDHFQCRVVDVTGHFTLSEEKTIMRVFDSYVEPVDPINGITVSPDNIELIWNPYNEQFFYTHSLFIYQAYTDIAVWDSTGISSTTTSVQVDTVLSAGAYYWRIAVIDEWGNSALSDKADFNVSD
jgi:hypothetical protein